MFITKFFNLFLTNRTAYSVFEEKSHPNLGEGDTTSPSSEGPTPSSISSPTEPTKSTNLEETESSNNTTESMEMNEKDGNDMDTRQTEDLDADVKPASVNEKRNPSV